MSLSNPLRRGALAAALSFALLGAAVAGDETRIGIRTQAGAVERLTVQDIDSIAVGETRALSTEGGNAATLSRTEQGYVLEVAGESFDLDALSSFDPAGLAGLPHHEGGHDGKHVVRKVMRHPGHGASPSADGEAKEGRRIVKIVRHGDPAAAEPGADAFADLAAGEGARVVVVRRLTHDGVPSTTD